MQQKAHDLPLAFQSTFPHDVQILLIESEPIWGKSTKVFGGHILNPVCVASQT
jgi:hypothetical protein